MTLIDETHNRHTDALRRAFREDNRQLAVVDDFLDGSRISEIASAVEHGEYYVEYGLMPDDEQAWQETRGRHVDRREYEAASPEQRYYRFSTTRSWSYRPGQRRLDGSCPLTLAELELMLEFMRAATGYDLGLIRCMVRSFAPGDYVGAHHENRLGRLVAAHLPVTDCDPEEQLVFRSYAHDGQDRDVPLTYNSLSFFDVRAQWREAIAPKAGVRPVRMLHFWYYA
jgi:hypothetical protein